jgi:acyl transferase domain-containing protein/surfactin synthase thioesterase subunit
MTLPNPATLSPLQQATLALKEMRAKIDRLEAGLRREPIAIVGMSCRFPGGADSPEAFWTMLERGTDAVGDVPKNRWDVERWYDPSPDLPGKSCVRAGAFLPHVDTFDAAFFGISRREAAAMDPQQRLLLEVAWEAMERACMTSERRIGDPTGVFVGAGHNSYAQSMPARVDQIEAWDLTGNSPALMAGRLSWQLGLHGPSLTLDTACSSSLVAVHLACQSLLAGDCTAAIAAGVRLMIAPEPFVMMARLRVLAPDGRCKTFDAAADGFGQGEGCGAVVLKKLSDARRDGDCVLAVLRGSAVNHDGPSSGLTVPNGLAQERLIQRALETAGIAPAQVSYVEAHGTGTSLGDPIEAVALEGVFGRGRSQATPLVIGSVKTNIGHLDAAAGIAGLIKVVLAMGHGAIPKHLHFDNPTPQIPWADFHLAVPRATTPWDGPKIAGVSSFGIGGTNAHLIVEEPPEGERRSPAQPRPCHLLCLSARHPESLRALAVETAAHLAASEGVPLEDLTDSAYTGRRHFPHRLAIVGRTHADLARGLEGFSAGATVPGVVTGKHMRKKKPRIAFMFSGQGAQTVGMARTLFETEPGFREIIERCAGIADRALPRPLLDVLFPPAGAESPIHDTLYTQPALFAVEVALAQLWRRFGVHPDLVFGHSVGEYAAACDAGVFGLEDGLRLVLARARLMSALPGDGAMAAVFTDEAQLAPILANHDRLSIAAVNGPREVVLSGYRTALEHALAELTAAGIKTRKLTVSHAFHSAQLDPMLDAFEAEAAAVPSARPGIPLVSNRTGGLMTEAPTAAYWRAQTRHAVRFDACVRTAAQEGIDLFIEIGPRPVLAAMGSKNLDGTQAFLASLRDGRDDWEQLFETAGALFVHGVALDFNALTGGGERRRCRLPTTPFVRERAWIDAADVKAEPPAIEATETSPAEPSLGQQLRALPREAREAALITWAQAAVANVLRAPSPDDIDPDEGFFDLGMDSLMSVELVKQCRAELGIALTTTTAFEYPDIRRLAAFIAGGLEDSPAPAAPVPTVISAPNEPIAIVGMACRFPGGANDLDAFWHLLESGRDAVREVPAERWSADAYFGAPGQAGKICAREGGFLDNVDVADFDAAFFGISPREAETMDPQQRLLLEVTWEALEHAGVPADSLAGTRTGVFVGATSADYAIRVMAASQIDPYAGTGNMISLLAGRVAFTLGLQGPAMTVDTACSSSLVALHLACQSLRLGEADLALAGGTHLMLHPRSAVYMSQLGALSTEGRSKAFDASANGYGRGEGCGVLVLKRLSDARAHGDRILALVRGSAVNHDGRSSGLTVPNGKAQEQVIQQALRAASLAPDQVGYLEAHGTGTPLGDPIEAHAFARALGPGRSRPLLVGSVKSAIGHLEAAAGIAGAIKVVLSLQHARIAPQLHLKTLNPAIDWGGVPVEIPTTSRPWPEDTRIAGVSAFGMSGTNAHVLFEAAPAAKAPAEPASSGPWVLPLSAKTPAALRAAAAAMKRFLEDVRPAINAVAFTAALRRTHFACRAAVVGATLAEWLHGLDAFGAGRTVPGLFVGDPTARPRAADLAEDPTARAIAEQWVAGGRVAWTALFADPAKPISLPGYPWQKTRAWIDAEAPVQSAPAVSTEAATDDPAPLDTIADEVRKLAAGALRKHAHDLPEAGTFFEWGMDSILVMELRGKLEAAFRCQLTVKDMFRAPTAHAVAARIAARQQGGAPPVTVAAPAVPASRSPWLRLHNRDAKARILCFPFSGAGASVFRTWPAAAPADIEIVPVQLPGREDRLDEPPFRSLAQLAEALTAGIAPLCDRPTALFGCSMGALLAFETARRLRKAGIEVAHLFAASCPAPHRPNRVAERCRTLQAAGGPEFQRWIDEVLGPDRDLQEVILPTLLADLQMVRDHVHTPDEPLRCPITAFGGIEDADIPRSELAPWVEHTRSDLAVKLFEGGHLFMRTNGPAVVAAMSRALAPASAIVESLAG